MTVTNLTSLDIGKDALELIAGPSISSLTDPTTTTEQTVARLYDLTVRSLMAKHPWAFVNVIRQCSIDADKAAEAGFDTSFRLPSSMQAGPFAVYANQDFKNPISDYAHMGDYIFADVARIDALVRINSTPDIWPQYFRILATTELAMRLAKAIADNTELMTELRIQAYGNSDEMNGGLFREAKKIDAQTKPMKSIFQNGDPLTGARLGGFGIPRRFRT